MSERPHPFFSPPPPGEGMKGERSDGNGKPETKTTNNQTKRGLRFLGAPRKNQREE